MTTRLECPFVGCTWTKESLGSWPAEVRADAEAHLNADHPGWTIEQLVAMAEQYAVVGP